MDVASDPPAGVSSKTSKKHPVDLPGLDDAIPSRVHYLTKQRTKMYKIIKEMHTSMGGQKEDSITELREAFYALIEDHCVRIRSLAAALGDRNALVKELEQGCGKIIEAANRAIQLASTYHMEPEDDWAEDVNSDWDEGSVDGLAEDDWDEDMNSEWGEVSVDGLEEDSVDGFADHNI